MPAKIVHHKTHITPENINDVSITFSWDNLEALCMDCHNNEHHANKKIKRYVYDDEGKITEM